MSGIDMRAAERVLSAMERRLLAGRKILEQAPDARSAHEYIAALEAEGDARRELFEATALSPRNANRSRRA